MKKRAVTMFRDGEDWLIFWSFRYFLGRMTIHACAFARELARAMPYIRENVRDLISADLAEAFAQDDRDRAGNHSYKRLGHDCDREAWEKVRTALAKLEVKK